MSLCAFDSNTRFLITGGAGFIGSNIAQTLVEEGYFVRILDDFSTGNYANTQDFCDHAEIIKGSICDYDTCVKAVCGIDYVLHQAAWGAIPRSIKMPLEYDLINVHGTLNMMQASVKQGIKKFIYASSSSVYGDEKALPKKEGHEGNLLAPYPITKAINELYAKNYYELYGLNTIGLRYFNVYGRRQDPKSDYAAVIPLFIKLLLENKRPTINGDGNFSRDFTYIDDVVQANIKACLADDAASGRVYNIAYGQKTAINVLFSTIAELLDKDITPKYGPVRKGDIPHSLADISNARDFIKYAPQYDITQGLKLTVEWYKEQYN